MFSKFNSALLGLSLLLFVPAQNAQACSSCGCSFNSDWASEGYSNSCGFRFDARFDYIDQNDLHYGSNGVSKSSFSFPSDDEVQQHTITRETLLGFDYSPDRFWGVHLTVPFLDRTHSTIAPGDIEQSHSSTSGLGDMSIVGRYQGFTPLANLGVQIGLKFPSGAFTDNFETGPQAGERIDRGLQNGTGTTDAILGIYNFGVLAPQLEYFVHLQADQPFQAREGFRSSTSVTTSTGIGYQATSLIRPQVQINYKYESRESGESSDRPNSGGNIIAITPGVSFAVSKDLNLYTLVQVPVYQQVNGYQLLPHAIYSIGARYTF